MDSSAAGACHESFAAISRFAAPPKWITESTELDTDKWLAGDSGYVSLDAIRDGGMKTDPQAVSASPAIAAVARCAGVTDSIK